MAVMITYKQLRELVQDIINTESSPTPYFPTIQDLETKFDEDMMAVTNETEKIHFFIWCIMSAFETDHLWHIQNPGYRENTVENNIRYLFIPAVSMGKPHTGVWNIGDDDEAIEDKETAFEYMQEYIMDRTYFGLKEAIKQADDLFFEIQIRCRFRDKVKNIRKNGANVLLTFKKSTGLRETTMIDFYRAYKYCIKKFPECA